jgi:hypothetical protein
MRTSILSSDVASDHERQRHHEPGNKRPPNRRSCTRCPRRPGREARRTASRAGRRPAPANELDGRAGEGPETPLLGPGTDAHEAAPERVRAIDREVRTVVRDERRHDEVELAVAAFGELEPLRVDVRGAHVRVTAVAAADPVGDVA